MPINKLKNLLSWTVKNQILIDIKKKEVFAIDTLKKNETLLEHISPRVAYFN